MNRKNTLYSISIIFLIVIIITLYTGICEKFDLTIKNQVNPKEFENTFYGDFNNTCKECSFNLNDNNLSCVCNNKARSSLKIDNIALGPIITNKDDKLALSKDQFIQIKHKNGKCIVPNFSSRLDGNWPVLEFRDCSGNNLNSQYRFLDNGSIRYRQATDLNQCIHPYKGKADENQRLVLGDNCHAHPFKKLLSNSIQHNNSGRCIHPSSGVNDPTNGTALVLRRGCGQAPSVFQF
jgi:hypothetical protein